MICLAMNPLDGTFAHNALEHGVAGLNVDGGRVAANGDNLGGGMVSKGRPKASEGWDRPWMHDKATTEAKKVESAAKVAHAQSKGRWPANIIHDGSEEVLAGFPVSNASGGPIKQSGSSSFCQSQRNEYKRIIDRGSAARFFKCCPQDNFDDGESSAPKRTPNRDHAPEGERSEGNKGIEVADTSVAPSSSRFFYCAKASKAERNRGCEGLEDSVKEFMGEGIKNITGNDPVTARFRTVMKNHHPTVKPLALMRYLCTLVTMPERNLILDPFAGSGTTGVACKELGLPCILIEQDEHHCEIVAARVAAAVRDEPEPEPERLPLLEMMGG